MQRYGIRRPYVTPSFAPLVRSARARAAESKYEEYRSAFARYDIDGNGRLDAWEIRQVFADVGVEPTEEQLKSIGTAIAHSEGGEGLTYEEFVSVLDRDAVVAEEGDERETLEAYVAMGGQPDKGGCVDAERIKQVIADFALTINIEELLELLDTDHSGEIEWSEFCCLFEDEEEMEELANPLSVVARRLQLDSSDDESEPSVNIQLLASSLASAINSSNLAVPSNMPSSIYVPTTPLQPRPPPAPRQVAAPSPRHR